MTDILIQPDAAADDDLSGGSVINDATLPLNAQSAAALGLTLGTAYKLRVLGDPATVTVTDVPAAFVDADWSVATGAGGSALDVTIAALPADNGKAITSVEYDVDASGSWTALPGYAGTGTYALTMAAPDTSYAIRLRSVNANGAGAAGNSESATSGAAPAGLNATALTYGPNGSSQTTLYRGTGPLFPTGRKSITLAGRVKYSSTATSILLGVMGGGGSSGFAYKTASVLRFLGVIPLEDGTSYTLQSPLYPTVNEWFEFLVAWDTDTAGLQAEQIWARAWAAGAATTWPAMTDDALTGSADKLIDFTDIGTAATATTYTFGNRDDGSDNRGLAAAQLSFGIWPGAVDLSDGVLLNQVFDGTSWNPDAISTALGADPGFFTPGTVAEADAGTHQGTANGGAFNLSFRTGNAS